VLTQTCTYTLTSATFNKAIRKILSYKNESSFVRLENALTLENKGNRYVHYLKLLGEDESGNQGHYCEMLRAQVCHFNVYLSATMAMPRLVNSCLMFADLIVYLHM
jgi:hypothetical protein